MSAFTAHALVERSAMPEHRPAFLRLFMNLDAPESNRESSSCVSENHGRLNPDSAPGNEGGYSSTH